MSVQGSPVTESVVNDIPEAEVHAEAEPESDAHILETRLIESEEPASPAVPDLSSAVSEISIPTLIHPDEEEIAVAPTEVRFGDSLILLLFIFIDRLTSTRRPPKWITLRDRHRHGRPLILCLFRAVPLSNLWNCRMRLTLLRGPKPARQMRAFLNRRYMTLSPPHLQLRITSLVRPKRPLLMYVEMSFLDRCAVD